MRLLIRLLRLYHRLIWFKMFFKFLLNSKLKGYIVWKDPESKYRRCGYLDEDGATKVFESNYPSVPIQPFRKGGLWTWKIWKTSVLMVGDVFHELDKGERTLILYIKNGPEIFPIYYPIADANRIGRLMFNKEEIPDGSKSRTN